MNAAWTLVMLFPVARRVPSLPELPCLISSAEAVAYNELSGIKSSSDRLKRAAKLLNNCCCVLLCDSGVQLDR
jgi:hypothetical protein